MKVEIGRVKGFSGGNFKCIKCGSEFRLYWNGGELDMHECCGIKYVTEHQEVDLVMYGDEEDKTDAHRYEQRREREGFYKNEGVAIYIKGIQVIGIHPQNVESNIQALQSGDAKIDWELLLSRVDKWREK